MPDWLFDAPVGGERETKGDNHFVFSMAAPVASQTHWKAPPFHGAHPEPPPLINRNLAPDATEATYFGAML